MLHVDLPPSARGGVAHQVHLLSSTLVRRGHAVTVVSTTPGPGGAPYDVRIVQLSGPAWASRLWGTAAAWRGLGLDTVVHAHGDDWLLPRSVRRLRTFYGSAASELLSASSAKRRIGQGFAYGTEWVSALRATSSVMIADNNRRFLPLVRDVVPCAVDDAFFTAVRQPSSDPTVLFVAGSLGGRKRGQLVVEAVRQVRRTLPGTRLVLVCPERVDEPWVEQHSRLPVDELAGLYARAWVLCSASSYEGFGVPYVEALAAGVPVVTTGNPGAREVLAGGRLGVLSAPEALAQDLLELLRDEPRRQALSELGRRAAHAYSADVVAAAYEARYEALG